MRLTLVILLLGRSAADHDYFQYEDCGEACTRERTSCTISEENGNFVTRCCSGEDCLARMNNEVVCLRPGEPPRGGEDIWKEFESRVHPSTTTTTPPMREDCARLKILLGVGWTISSALILFHTCRVILRRIRRRPHDSDEETDVFHNPNYRPATPEIENAG